MDKKDRICSIDNPAPKGTVKWAYMQGWDTSWDHPEAFGRCINDDHDDWRYDCPHCKCGWIYEGPDA